MIQVQSRKEEGQAGVSLSHLPFAVDDDAEDVHRQEPQGLEEEEGPPLQQGRSITESLAQEPCCMQACGACVCVCVCVRGGGGGGGGEGEVLFRMWGSYKAIGDGRNGGGWVVERDHDVPECASEMGMLPMPMSSRY